MYLACGCVLQTGSFMFPINPRCPSTPQSLTPKMMQLRFGANSPRPSPFYSPSSNSVQHFRCGPIVGSFGIYQQRLNGGGLDQPFPSIMDDSLLVSLKATLWVTDL